MKKLFVAIRHGDIDTVKSLLQSKPGLISCVAKQPPKKDDGQSPLQVALKTGSFDIAEYLLDLGADINFIESENCTNEWRMPAVQDAITAAVMNCRYVRTFDGTTIEFCKTKANADRAFEILQKAFINGADITAHDSYGTSCLGRALLCARQILPQWSWKEKKIIDKRPLNKELVDDLNRIFDFLLAQGADINEIDAKYEKTYKDFYANDIVAQFFIK